MTTLLSGLKNWHTTTLGLLGGVHNLMSNLSVFSTGTTADKINLILQSLGIAVIGLFAKDANKTGILGQQ